MNCNLLLYIDPGTGSMLFSIMIGLGTAVYFLAKNIWLRIKFFFTGRSFSEKSNQNRAGIVIYNEGNQYWNVFSPILEQFEAKQVPIAYFTSSKTDPVFEHSYNYILPKFIGEGNKAFTKLNFLEADICLMTTPGLDVYQLKRSKGVSHYAHILHAVDDATGYRLFGLDYFDSVFLTGEYQIDPIRELETKRNIRRKELIVVGCTYLDRLRQKISEIPAESVHPFTVLVSPSWGPSGLLSSFGERLLDPLVKSGWRIIIRPHPQSLKSESDMIQRLRSKYEMNKTVEWDISPNNLSSLSKSDIMISDFSGIIFDYCFLFDKPFLYVNRNFDDEIYDSSDIAEKPWKFRILKDIGIELNEEGFPTMKTIIEAAANNDVLRENRARAKATAWHNQGNSAECITDELLRIQKDISC